ncbi:hypothetical protein SBOR_4680 [Sclerotinia borealis F-4128]|uniref:Uncharacterized protein n=1 Tax=Sclerotinia borealis (strain F-4128) TaxID=1432307 RepID=W9CG79_SCLBF|nr:hypothetical protein SBOR_4680 [Sclerotinia borealis F-4128]
MDTATGMMDPSPQNERLETLHLPLGSLTQPTQHISPLTPHYSVPSSPLPRMVCYCENGILTDDDPIKIAYLAFTRSYHDVTCKEDFNLSFGLFIRLLCDLFFWLESVSYHFIEEWFDEWIIRIFIKHRCQKLIGPSFKQEWLEMMNSPWMANAKPLIDRTILDKAIRTSAGRNNLLMSIGENEAYFEKMHQDNGAYPENYQVHKDKCQRLRAFISELDSR